MSGIHHITAIAGDAARNHDFYTRVLGMRLVKKTVNFDDPGTYHLYFADETGSPGTVLTFFPWGHAPSGRNGVGQAQQTMLRVPESAIGYWAHRLVEKGVPHEAIEKRFGQSVLAFTDPDGLSLAFVGVPGAEAETAWAGGDVPVEHAVRGFHGIRLLLDEKAPTAAVLTKALGFREAESEGPVSRFIADGSVAGSVVEIREAKGFLPAHMGRGSVHHVAFRAADDQAQADMRRKLVDELHIQVTEQIDRNYFRSMYFREPGGIIFEIATDAPGFAIDEAQSELGTELKLPAFLEKRRDEIEARLQPLTGVAA
ncbi:ring-cleaving dioxygenase [Hyphomicrobium methylovorum]|uniref:ring-cleaving dioxygenase n=1 Tax=Hyphomicrobium methylovorum TaxID=84 RepID=UPI0015E76E3C|nr:ring-cleaving dioxygenase [Hyphomicrobium methylovorum]MBA2125910.1 ring-cleaving dioxygenase [Hyphomicrobium methylovorum]